MAVTESALYKKLKVRPRERLHTSHFRVGRARLVLNTLQVNIHRFRLNCAHDGHAGTQGAEPFFLFAGPNVIQSQEHCFKMCRHIKAITDRFAAVSDPPSTDGKFLIDMRHEYIHLQGTHRAQLAVLLGI